MNTLAGGPMRLMEGSRSPINAAVVTSVKRANASDDLRSDTEPTDLVRVTISVVHTTSEPG